MIRQAEFWGGPRDGDVLNMTGTSPDEIVLPGLAGAIPGLWTNYGAGAETGNPPYPVCIQRHVYRRQGLPSLGRLRYVYHGERQG